MAESSILNDLKKLLGVDQHYTAFDSDIIIHANSAFTVLNDLGVGPDSSFVVKDVETWEELELPDDQLGMVKSYIFMKVRLAFDPPTMGFLLDALSKQIEEQEWRLKERRESLIPRTESEVWHEWSI